ncbi:MAG: hypothetical protein DME24_03490 [Verrucomicrobia bacterium]|nr:MAG: hypothetical protein DME24_03490 [Verrucomicrobiota bacterium]
MMETVGKYCISTVEIQYGFHAQLSSSRHTKGVPPLDFDGITQFESGLLLQICWILTTTR